MLPGRRKISIQKSYVIYLQFISYISSFQIFSLKFATSTLVQLEKKFYCFSTQPAVNLTVMYTLLFPALYSLSRTALVLDCKLFGHSNLRDRFYFRDRKSVGYGETNVVEAMGFDWGMCNINLYNMWKY